MPWSWARIVLSLASPRKVAARRYVASGMLHEAIKELGRWRWSVATEKACGKAPSAEEAPEMRMALKGSSDRQEVDRLVKDLWESVTLVGEDEVGVTGWMRRRQWYTHFVRVPDMLEPETAAQTCANFLALMVPRVRELDLSTA